MAEPWERYTQPEAEVGPWTKYAGGAEPPSFLTRIGRALRESLPSGPAPDWPEFGPQFRRQISDVASGVAAEPGRVYSSLEQAGTALRRGELGEAAYHAAGAVPFVGPGAQQVGRDVGEGKYAEAVGHAIPVLAPAVPGMASAARATPAALRSAGQVVRKAVTSPGAGQIATGALEVGAGTTAAVTGGPFGKVWGPYHAARGAERMRRGFQANKAAGEAEAAAAAKAQARAEAEAAAREEARNAEATQADYERLREREAQQEAAAEAQAEAEKAAAARREAEAAQASEQDAARMAEKKQEAQAAAREAAQKEAAQEAERARATQADVERMKEQEGRAKAVAKTTEEAQAEQSQADYARLKEAEQEGIDPLWERLAQSQSRGRHYKNLSPAEQAEVRRLAGMVKAQEGAGGGGGNGKIGGGNGGALPPLSSPPQPGLPPAPVIPGSAKAKAAPVPSEGPDVTGIVAEPPPISLKPAEMAYTPAPHGTPTRPHYEAAARTRKTDNVVRFLQGEKVTVEDAKKWGGAGSPKWRAAAKAAGVPELSPESVEDALRKLEKGPTTASAVEEFRRMLRPEVVEATAQGEESEYPRIRPPSP